MKHRKGDRAIFNTHGQDSEWKTRDGETVEILRPLTESEADLFDVGPMFRVKFTDGTECDAFEDELYCLKGDYTK